MPTRPVRRLAIAASLVVVACLVAPSRAQEKGQEKKKDPAAVLKSLEQRVKDYQDENATLRERVKELEGQVRTLKQNRVVNVVPQPGGTAGQVPPHWKSFQFNGGTYYVVPLAEGQGADRFTLGTNAQEQPRRAQGPAPTVVLPAPQK